MTEERVEGGPASIADAKPRLRGVSHQIAFFFALAGAAALIIAAPDAKSRIAMSIYGLTLCAMFGTSAAYHRGRWSPSTSALLRRLDHSMIFAFVAGSYTPFAVIVLDETVGTAMLVVAWVGALAGIALSLGWIDAPRWVTAGAYVALGWASVIGLPQLLDRSGAGAVALLGAGGLLYTLGAVVYARKSPDPSPHHFGFHEIFHLFVVAAAITHYVAIEVYALPD